MHKDFNNQRDCEYFFNYLLRLLEECGERIILSVADIKDVRESNPIEIMKKLGYQQSTMHRPDEIEITLQGDLPKTKLEEIARGFGTMLSKQEYDPIRFGKVTFD